jgi:hypothetical protein
MKDFLDQELKIGDNVIMITPNYRDLKLAQVVKFTAKNVRVAYNDQYGSCEMLQHSSQLVRVQGPMVTKYLLKHSKT